MSIISVVLVGVCSGVVSGMGMGGGTIFIPLSSIILGLEQKEAQGINLIAFIPTAIVALIIHIKNHLVNFRVGIVVICAGIVTSVCSAILANNIGNTTLKKAFGVFLLIVGAYQAITSIKSYTQKESTEYKFNFWYK